MINSQQDATQSSLFIILQVHSICFGSHPHPSLEVHKTVTTASGTAHIFCAPNSNVAKPWPRWRKVWLTPETCTVNLQSNK